MKLKQQAYHLYIPVFILLLFYASVNAQTPAVLPTPVVNTDTTRSIEILGGNTLRLITLKDGTELQTLAGNAVVRQGRTTLKGDSIVLNSLTNIAEVFGHVHINDADTVNTYAGYLKYLGKERIAYLKKNVKLTDGKGTLLTEDLEYNLATGIASYKNGGRVINGSTVLTSSDAVYYSDTRDVYFKKFVHLTDPDYDIKADSLMYNTLSKIATFIAPTKIVTKEQGVINTKSGTYNLQTGEAIFLDRTSYSDSTRSIVGGKIAYDEKSGILQIEENGKLVDSVNNVTVIANQILLDKYKNSFLATRKPVMILYRNNDSTYVAADTLFSGLRKYDSTQRTSINATDTMNKVVAMNLKNVKDSIRYFLAFNNTRIFNDSLQAVCDSLYYSTEDSVFRMFRNPIAWNGYSQLNGDTMYMYTINQQPKELQVFNNSLVVNETTPGLYNQMAGRTLNAYFKEGNIDYIRIKGSPAESIYYPQDEDSAYIGMNRSSGDVIDVYFENKELNKVTFVNDVNGTLYPLKQIPADEKSLKAFKWLDAQRPKHKLELFE
ncbi:MAG TPA: OstA-like protein [Ferruginibacter sp.]|nr:OstA-like protein [Ferruginibacter sp.]HRE64713.1 OstA-like protein [Ferruginibacter sp.]